MPGQKPRSPFIGRTISLISRLDIRYEGTLYMVDHDQCTISLTNVRSWGTEDRQPGFKIAAHDEIFEYIVFKANDIKNIILPDIKSRRPSNTGGLAYDPAIVSVVSAPTTLSSSPAVNALLTQTSLARARGGDDSFNYHYNNRYPPSPPPAPFVHEQSRYKTDFDFERANEEFAKLLTQDCEKKKESGDTSRDENEKEETYYDKSTSFFDRISHETHEKERPRWNWQQARKTNEATFGQRTVRDFFRHFARPSFNSYNNNYYYHDSVPSSRGGGGRGFYHGRGRGRGGGGFYRGRARSNSDH